MAKRLVVVVAGLFFLAIPSFGQEAPSLADVARKARAEKNGTAAVHGQQPSSAVDVSRLKDALLPDFQAAANRADEQERAAATQSYFHQVLLPYYGNTYGPVLESCFAKPLSSDNRNFAFVVAFDAGGRVLKIYQDHETGIFLCLREALQKDVFPRPPVSPYYLHVVMQFADNPDVAAAGAANKNAPPPPVQPDFNPKLDKDIDGIPKYQAAVRELLKQEKFDALDQIATEYRASRARFPGGFWKLHTFQDALSEPAGGDQAREAEWLGLLQRLNKWVALRPNSISARTALAAFYLAYGWNARGGDHPGTITEDGGKLFVQRVAKARSVAEDALAHQLKDPELLLTLMRTAQSEEREMDDQMALFETAVAFEPDYYYFYRVIAGSLQPKWGGEPGEMAQWAEQEAKRIGGQKGDVIYYEIATFVNCQCDADRGLNGMSWEWIQRGYGAVEHQYGPALETLNQFAYMAAMANDPTTANAAFDRIGENWFRETWRNRNSFDGYRIWAKANAGPPNMVQR